MKDGTDGRANSRRRYAPGRCRLSRCHYCELLTFAAAAVFHPPSTLESHRETPNRRRTCRVPPIQRVTPTCCWPVNPFVPFLLPLPHHKPRTNPHRPVSTRCSRATSWQGCPLQHRLSRLGSTWLRSSTTTHTHTHTHTPRSKPNVSDTAVVYVVPTG